MAKGPNNILFDDEVYPKGLHERMQRMTEVIWYLGYVAFTSPERRDRQQEAARLVRALTGSRDFARAQYPSHLEHRVAEDDSYPDRFATSYPNSLLTADDHLSHGRIFLDRRGKANLQRERRMFPRKDGSGAWSLTRFSSDHERSLAEVAVSVAFLDRNDQGWHTRDDVTDGYRLSWFPICANKDGTSGMDYKNGVSILMVPRGDDLAIVKGVGPIERFTDVYGVLEAFRSDVIGVPENNAR